MAHMIAGANPTLEALVYQDMYRTRKAVFIDLLRWDLPALNDEYELDAFDDPHATYLILADEDGSHRGSMRLLPTTRPHLLDTLFPHLCDADVPAAPDIFEISRFCISPRLRSAERRKVRDQLVSTCVDFALLNGIAAYTCVADLRWMNKVQAFGWRCEPLGLALPLNCGVTGALRIDIDGMTSSLLKAKGIYCPTEIRSIDSLAA